MDPRLAELAEVIDKTRWAAVLIDPEWRLMWVSTEMKVLLQEQDDEKLGIGAPLLETWTKPTWSDTITAESQVKAFHDAMPYILAETPGGLEGLVDEWGEGFRPLFESIEPRAPATAYVSEIDYLQGEGVEPERVRVLALRVHAPDGTYLGSLQLFGSGLPARILALVARGDEGLFGRMANLVQPGRRPAAVVFADMQGSGVLSRKLPSAAYFRLISEAITAIDRVVLDNTGIVGSHAGDGATAFFLADDLGSSSGAAAAAVRAARGISEAVDRAAKQVAQDLDLVEVSQLKVNVGAHWGGMLYMGQLVTGGRLEVTALGDAVNECARIQASARDGEVLASKDLLEHLTAADAEALGLDPDGVVYRTVSELPGVGDKAVRDAGSIAVTVL